MLFSRFINFFFSPLLKFMNWLEFKKPPISFFEYYFYQHCNAQELLHCCKVQSRWRHEQTAKTAASPQQVSPAKVSDDSADAGGDTPWGNRSISRHDEYSNESTYPGRSCCPCFRCKGSEGFRLAPRQEEVRMSRRTATRFVDCRWSSHHTQRLPSRRCIESACVHRTANNRKVAKELIPIVFVCQFRRREWSSQHK